MKNVIITGGTGDLGQIVVPRLLRDYACAVVHRSRSSFERLAPHERLRGLASLDEIATVGPIHALVNLAGGFASGSTADDLAMMLETNTMTAARAIDAVIPHLAAGGRIVAISSVAALDPSPGFAAYAASKAALNALIRSRAKELAPSGITANALLPSSMDTPQNLASTPASKLVPRTNVAELIAFLLGESATNVSGQLIELRA